MSLDETKLFEILPVDSFILKTGRFDLDKYVNPDGTLIIGVNSIGECHPGTGLPDYYMGLELLGITYVECDPDKETLRRMHADVLTAVKLWTPELVTQAFGLLPPARVCGILNITSNLTNDKTSNRFRLDCRLVLTDVDFTANDFFPTAHLGAPYLVDEEWNEAHTVKTAYICYSDRPNRPITRVVTTYTDAWHKTVVIEFAYGAWDDRKTLVYTRN